ncbi:MAG: Transcriptional regulator, AcrR family [uncultured Corynebacteriales bacterium]|uniref:Transcriptional regulator, AcrR family n=1 Tax=uncultured Mycobacteriales bacterium TaxID=581187 RepID=A0A6J4JRB5_9ACTN|nr:MAG: Transcriptional regulator, AcrR family [uncultured Corynebacteriales bacterium]
MTGLRERKKRQTRQAIYAAAVRLFGERGWHATTVADIAAAADIAPRTFFAYFPAKEDVLFAPYEDLFTGFDELMLTRPHGGSVLDELRTWLDQVFVQQAEDFDPVAEALLDKLSVEVDSIAAKGLQIMDRAERGLAAALADELGSPAGDALPAMVAAAAVAVLRSIPVAGIEQPAEERARQAVADLDRAFLFIRAGLAALRSGSATAPAGG